MRTGEETERLNEESAMSISSAAGNRFQVWDGFISAAPSDPSGAAIEFCKSGLNDGLLLVLPVSEAHADCQMVLYNADGGRAETCGNGLRCVGKLMYEAARFEATTTLRVQTDVGVVAVRVYPNAQDQIVRSARVQFALPQEVRAIELSQSASDTSSIEESATIEATFVDLGNPHCVILGALEDLENVTSVGKALEHHPAFPNRANIEFVYVEPDATDSLVVRVWERGVGETLACGSGAVAAAYAAVWQGIANWPITVKMRGGVLRVDGDESNLWLEGPVED